MITSTARPSRGSGSQNPPPRGPPWPKPPPSQRTKTPLATDVSRKNSRNSRPTRRLKRRRLRQSQPPGPAGGNGSPSGHQGGRPHGGPPPDDRGRAHGGPDLGPYLWSRIGEPVPDAVDGQQVARPGGGRLKLLADVLDVGVDRPLVGLERDPVHRVEELAAGEDAARLAHQHRQELELGRRQLDRLAADRDAHPGDVHLDAGHAQHLRPTGPRRLAAPQHRAHARDQLLGAERLDHVVVGAELEADDPVGLVATGRQDDDRHARGPPQAAGHVEPVPPGQAEVEHDQVGLEAPRAGERGLAVTGNGHLEPGGRLPAGLAGLPAGLAGLLVLPAVPLVEPLLPRALPPGPGPAVAAGTVATGAVAAGTAPATRTAPASPPEQAAEQQDEPDQEQREQDEPEREEAVPGTVAPAPADLPHDLDTVAALRQLLGDALVDPGVVGADRDPDHCQDHQQRHSDDESPSHRFLLHLTGRLPYTTDAAVAP